MSVATSPPPLSVPRCAVVDTEQLGPSPNPSSPRYPATDISLLPGVPGQRGAQGPPGIQGTQGIQGIQGISGSNAISGTAQLDFGLGNKTAEVVVTGIASTLTTSRVTSTMRVEATVNHSVDDLLVDPIRTLVKNLVIGVGFTIYGEMDNATANGLYKADWFISNE
jgi:hypothetical protein